MTAIIATRHTTFPPPPVNPDLVSRAAKLGPLTNFVDWERVFDKPNWLDNEKFGFNFLHSQLLIFANSAIKQSETIIEEKDWKWEEIEGMLRRLIYRGFVNDKEIVEWMNK